MSIIYKKSASRTLLMEEREHPQLYREVFPYSKIGRIEFDDVTIPELVPPITSTLISLSSNAFNIPAWAIPLIPPPDKATPNFTFTTSFFFLLVLTNKYDFKQYNVP